MDGLEIFCDLPWTATHAELNEFQSETSPEKHQLDSDRTQGCRLWIPEAGLRYCRIMRLAGRLGADLCRPPDSQSGSEQRPAVLLSGTYGKGLSSVYDLEVPVDDCARH